MKTLCLKKSIATEGRKCCFVMPACLVILLSVMAGVVPVSAQPVMFDFDNAPLHSSLPVSQTAGGITAYLTATGQGFSIQEANALGFTPQGFAGRCIYPNSIYQADLHISFDHTLTNFSILYACQELGCDDAALMRVTAYLNGDSVGTNTKTASNPGTWPSDVLSCSFSQGFNSVVIHYDHRPPTCSDYGVIFMADNMEVTPLNVNAILNLTVFLEGYYSGAGMMTNTLYNLFLSNDPTVTDTVEVDLWLPSHLGYSVPDYQAKGLLHQNGTASLIYPIAIAGNSYYIAVRHRNSLETWSHDVVPFSTTTQYDFSTGLSKAYYNGFNLPMKYMGSGVYALFGGNPSGDHGVDASDFAAVDNDSRDFLFGYYSTDCNGDGATDAADMAVIDNNIQFQLFIARPH